MGFQAFHSRPEPAAPPAAVRRPPAVYQRSRAGPLQGHGGAAGRNRSMAQCDLFPPASIIDGTGPIPAPAQGFERIAARETLDPIVLLSGLDRGHRFSCPRDRLFERPRLELYATGAHGMGIGLGRSAPPHRFCHPAGADPSANVAVRATDRPALRGRPPLAVSRPKRAESRLVWHALVE